MTVDALVGHARSRSRWLLVDTVELWEPGEEEFDPDTGQYVTGDPTVHYTGAGLVRPQPTSERQVEVGDAAVTKHRYDVWLPAEAHVQLYNDDGDRWRVTVLSSRYDAELEGVELPVYDFALDSLGMVRKLTVEDQRS